MSRSTDQSRFATVPKAEIPRSSFDRSHGHKTTFDADYLVPIFLDEVLPGDTFSLNMSGFGRLATPIYPIMDNLYLDTFFFFVPTRLVWTDFKKFMGEQDAPGDSTDYLVPVVRSPGAAWGTGTLGDYFGVPTGVATEYFDHSSLPFRAYNLIWNEWFRDQNLQDPVAVNKTSGNDGISQFKLLKRGKRHDYFTSCLPWPQKGDAVSIPLGDSAPVLGIGSGAPLAGSTGTTIYDGLPGSGPRSVTGANVDNLIVELNSTTLGQPVIRADLTEATEVTINQLRQSFQVQKLLERDARGGTRYTEIVRSHFGVTSPDARLQRPEYLGGGSTPINISPVAQTQRTDEGSTPLGQLAAFGTVQASGHGFTQSFTEHGFIIGLACVRADLNYQEGLDRLWTRRTRYDYYWPALAHIGEQAVLNQEIYLQASSETNKQAFGYQERYAEYRYKPSKITGLFRSSAATPLDSWHLAQDFGSLPLLNDEFIEQNTPLDRVIAVPDEPHIIFDSYFQLRCARPMPVYGVPGLIDHF